MVYWAKLIERQKLVKETFSSMSYCGYVTIGIIVFVNYFFLGEELTKLQLIAALLISLLGILFVFYGHLSLCSVSSKIKFGKIILILSIIPITDMYVISKSNWYICLFGSMLTLTVLSIFSNIGKDNWKAVFRNKTMISYGFMQAFTDVFSLVVSVVIIPITIPITILSIIKQIPSLINMVIASIIWKEGTIGNQLIFGIIAMILSVLIIIPIA